ncbi:protein disulfide-isomerase-like isoform X1 [Nicotiana tomentosiformis]|uniref:protein disulfide-isomerase-like isoform X1 n=2 Tax=Nicotiana tomentosiformis TaxID=4098 RepID=UPI00051C21FC|nr:protein disulfide-isomerase-like isoform X1 [Nicotiana tomentosiformis]
MANSCKVFSTLLAIFAVLATVAAVYADSAENEGQKVVAEEQEFVWTLDHTNYSDIISRHKMIVVEFYAPWCGYCQQLTPKYEEAASVLSSHDPPVILAKMDTTIPENAELARNYTHNGVPSIKIFRNGGKTVHDYKGTRETDGIISYLKKHAGPASLEIKSKEDAASLIDEKKIVVVGIFPELCLEKIKNFTALAEDLRVDYDFVHTLDAKFLPHGGPVDKPTIRLFKPFDELYADFEDFQVEAMQNFIEETSVPIMAILDDKPENQAFVNHFLHSPGDKVFLFLNFTTDLDLFKSKYYDLAATYKGKEANFLLGDAETGKRALEYFGLNTDQVPLIFVLAMDGTKYVERHVQPDSLAAWLKDFKDGKLKPYLKSQPIPEVNNEPVKVVVAETLEDMVFNSGKDVLLEFYRLGCKYCEEFAPVLDEIALSFENDAHVLIAKIDGTENDIPRERFEVQGFPTLYMISTAGSLSRFEGNRTKEAIIEFIQTNRGTPAPSNLEKSDLPVPEHAQIQTDSMKDEL